MHIGDTRLTKVDGKLKECIVIEMKYEDVMLDDEGTLIQRKYWEVRKPLN